MVIVGYAQLHLFGFLPVWENMYVSFVEIFAPVYDMNDNYLHYLPFTFGIAAMQARLGAGHKKMRLRNTFGGASPAALAVYSAPIGPVFSI